jgi:RND family efflux transporter MFP subunit
MYSGAPTAASGGKSAIVTLMQINPVKVSINVSEQYFTQVTSGMPARITSDIFPGEVFSGRVNLVYPTINALTRSFQAEIEVPNKNEKLRPGMFVRVAMDLGEVETFVVSASAVLVQEGTNIRYVFVEENGVVNRVEVAPGKRYDDMIEIISEKLAEGARIVTQGQSRLTSGDKVEVVR